MKSSILIIYINLLLLPGLVSAQSADRFTFDKESQKVRYFGAAKLPDGRQSYSGLEKQAWADAVQYLYRNAGLLAQITDFSDEDLKANVKNWVAHLRSKNTIYFASGEVRVYLEFPLSIEPEKKKPPVATAPLPLGPPEIPKSEKTL